MGALDLADKFPVEYLMNFVLIPNFLIDYGSFGGLEASILKGASRHVQQMWVNFLDGLFEGNFEQKITNEISRNVQLRKFDCRQPSKKAVQKMLNR